MDKKICIISANCQGAYIEVLLKQHPKFSQDFEVFYFVNYLKQTVPEELLKKADLLIYQPLGSHYTEIDNIIPIHISKKEQTIIMENNLFDIKLFSYIRGDTKCLSLS